MTYMDGTVARKLDLTEIELSDRSVSYFQNENFIIRNGIPWLKLGTSTMDEVLRIHPLNQCEQVFYDHNRKIRKERFLEISPSQICSLMLIKPEKAY